MACGCFCYPPLQKARLCFLQTPRYLSSPHCRSLAMLPNTALRVLFAFYHRYDLRLVCRQWAGEFPKTRRTLYIHIGAFKRDRILAKLEAFKGYLQGQHILLVISNCSLTTVITSRKTTALVFPTRYRRNIVCDVPRVSVAVLERLLARKRQIIFQGVHRHPQQFENHLRSDRRKPSNLISPLAWCHPGSR